MIEELELFTMSREEKLENEVRKLQEQTEKVRKSLFSKYTELMTLFLEVKAELEETKNRIKEMAHS